MFRAMVKIQEYLTEYAPNVKIVMQVHDELVVDCPAGKGPTPWIKNLPKIRKIQQIMEERGTDIGVPLRTSREYHANNYSEGKSV